MSPQCRPSVTLFPLYLYDPFPPLSHGLLHFHYIIVRLFNISCSTLLLSEAKKCLSHIERVTNGGVHLNKYLVGVHLNKYFSWERALFNALLCWKATPTQTTQIGGQKIILLMVVVSSSRVMLIHDPLTTGSTKEHF